MFNSLQYNCMGYSDSRHRRVRLETEPIPQTFIKCYPDGSGMGTDDTSGWQRSSRRAYLEATALGAGLLAGCSLLGSETSKTIDTTVPETISDDGTTTSDAETGVEDSTTSDGGTSSEKLEPNRAVLDEPFVDTKLTIAHYMTGMLPFENAEAYWTDPRYYDPNGPTSGIGGAMLHAAVPALLNRTDDDRPVGLSAEEAVRLELQAAKRFGVDVFEFYYPWIGDTEILEYYNSIIEHFFEVAAADDADFRFTLAVSHPTVGETQTKVAEIGDQIASLVEAVGDTGRWLTTPDGTYVIGTWLPDGLALGADQYRIPNEPALIQDVATAYDHLADRIGVDVAWLYDLHFAANYPDHTDYVDAALDYFPAVHGWHTGCEDEAIWDYVAEQCDERGRTFAQDAYGDFATGKFYTGVPPEGGVFSADEAASLCPYEITRWDVVLHLSRHFRDGLAAATDRDADMVYLSTWNDYGEGHHVAPEINHNFGFAQLLQYFLAQWRDTPEEAPGDVAIVFFKKYPSDVTPNPFDIDARTDTPCGEGADEIEVVTILDGVSTLRVNDDDPVSVDGGLDVSRFPMEPGHVDVTVTRDGSEVANFTTPESITDAPFRHDRLTFAYSSEHETIYRDLFGTDADVVVSNQYATEDLADGPNYGQPESGVSEACKKARETQLGRTVNIGHTSSVPDIDGTLGQVWNAAAEHTLNYVAVGSRDGERDLSGTWWALWDPDALYVRVDVTDDRITAEGGTWWEGDTVECYVDGDNSKGVSYDGENDFQIGFVYDESGVHTGTNSVSDTTGIEHAWSDIDAGYRLEATVPWSTIGVSPTTGDRIGFDVAVDDNDGNGREAQMFWNDDTGSAWRTPSVFGTLVLK